MKASDWIDRAKAAKGWESDYRAAKELGITRGAMSQIRTGSSLTLSEELAIKVAEAVGVNPANVVLDQLAQRTKSEPLRSTIAQLCILCKVTFATNFVAAFAKSIGATARKHPLISRLVGLYIIVISGKKTHGRNHVQSTCRRWPAQCGHHAG